MERLHVNQIREIIYRLRQGYSERQVAGDMGMSRVTVHKYYMLAFVRGYLNSECELPSDRELVAKLGPKMAPPWMESTVAPYGEVVRRGAGRSRRSSARQCGGIQAQPASPSIVARTKWPGGMSASTRRS